MTAAALLLSFLNLCLYIAVILLIAFVILWVIQNLLGVSLDANILKWGKIVVALLCLIAVVAWLLGVLGGSAGVPRLLW